MVLICVQLPPKHSIIIKVELIKMKDVRGRGKPKKTFTNVRD